MKKLILGGVVLVVTSGLLFIVDEIYQSREIQNMAKAALIECGEGNVALVVATGFSCNVTDQDS